MSYEKLTKTSETYTVYLIEENVDEYAIDAQTLDIEHTPENGMIKIDIHLERWRTCDEMVNYLEWITNQILKFKDLKGK